LSQTNAKIVKSWAEAKKDKWKKFLFPASRWRLYSSFTNGIQESGSKGIQL